MTLELARKAIAEERLGARGEPDLLAISLSATDYLGHEHGPDSIEMHDHLVALDRELGLFFDHLDRTIGRDGFVLAFSADHGVLPTPESEAGKQLKAQRLPESDFIGYLDREIGKQFGPPAEKAHWVLLMSPPNLYLNLPFAKEKGVSEASLAQAAAAALERHPMVARVYHPEDLAPGRTAAGPFAAEIQRGFRRERSGDLIVVFKSGVLYGDYGKGTGHGSPYDYDARIPMVFMGPGVKAGRYDREALATDLAPTLARMLGFQLDLPAPTRVLAEILRPEASPKAIEPAR